jgi:hypothetical protein
MSDDLARSGSRSKKWAVEGLAGDNTGERVRAAADAALDMQPPDLMAEVKGVAFSTNPGGFALLNPKWQAGLQVQL